MWVMHAILAITELGVDLGRFTGFPETTRNKKQK